ncbi:MAG: dihydrolipoamide dehydrogenase [Planctomycetaceae bacterium]
MVVFVLGSRSVSAPRFIEFAHPSERIPYGKLRRRVTVLIPSNANRPMPKTYDLIVIGAGPGGYVAAIRAAQLGLKTAVVEREAKLGGTCLRVGCIPSKALLESTELLAQAQHSFADRGIIVGQIEVDLPKMMLHKETVISELDGGIQGLLKKNKVDRLFGNGQLLGDGRVSVDQEGQTDKYAAKNILIATGSVPSSFPGMQPDGDRIGTSTEALSWPTIPDRLVVIGAGVIGLELGTVWRRLGSKVQVLEFLPRILPGTDAQVAREAQRILERQGIEFRLKTRVVKVSSNGTTCTIDVADAEPLECDRVLIAVGRKPYTDGLGLAEAGVETDDRGFVRVNSSYQTTADGVFAVGDVIGGAMLAHKAEEEGIACVEKVATGHNHINYGTIPAVIYTAPEIASVGRNEEELIEVGQAYNVGRFSFAANGRARAAGQMEGFVKILADADTDRVLGIHIIGAHAGELIAEAAVAMEFGASSEDIARCCHAHPTLAEAVKEAALAVGKRSLHS